MRTRRYLVICLILVVMGLGSLAEGANGNAGVHFGYPLSANSVQFSVTSSGAWALLGVFGALGGIVFFLLALIASMHRSDAVQLREKRDYGR